MKLAGTTCYSYCSKDVRDDEEKEKHIRFFDEEEEKNISFFNEAFT